MCLLPLYMNHMTADEAIDRVRDGYKGKVREAGNLEGLVRS